MSSAPGQGTTPIPGSSDSSLGRFSLTGNLRRLFSHVKVENLAAGLSGGVVSTLVLHPLDLVKIRFAVSDGLELRPKYRGIWHCMRSIWQQEGLRGLYQGVTPNVWGSGASWGLYFFFYNAIKAYIKEGRQTELRATEHLVAAAEAGAMTLCLTNPIWVTKTRLVLQYSTDPSKKPYKGMVDTLVKIYRQEGIPGLYRGFVPGLFGTSHGALQFMAYEELKRDYSRHRRMHSDAKLNPLEYITMAALSKIFAVVTTYPYQVVRARLQDQHNSYSGVLDVIRRTWRNEGALGFYKGLVSNMIRVTPACCITFVVYETASGFLLGQQK
ncbi:solute carrier family 25 member 32b [Electrophorus electricus]|nr:solute carrier family 25 member 32b [Electrophorus electricus]